MDNSKLDNELVDNIRMDNDNQIDNAMMDNNNRVDNARKSNNMSGINRSESMLELMTWQEIVDQLKNDGRFKMAAMFDLGGKLIAASEDTEMEPGDAIGVLKTMEVNNNTICGLFICGEKFSCISIDSNSVVGRAYHEVFSAFKTNNMLVCTVCESRTDYSTLGFIKNFMRSLNTQEDKTQTLV